MFETIKIFGVDVCWNAIISIGSMVLFFGSIPIVVSRMEKKGGRF